MSENIEGKVVVITGASSGLGESTARHLAKLGASVVLSARRTDRLDAIVKGIKADGGTALAETVDVTVRSQSRSSGTEGDRDVWQDRRSGEQCRYYADCSTCRP